MTARKKGGKALPLLCNLIGILILLGVLAICLPLTVPRLAGYEIFNVESGSMEPDIPAGSVVYVRDADPAEIQPEEVIAFTREGQQIVHRVTENWIVEGQFVTKGDANPIEDLANVPYSDFIGRVTYHIPFLGGFLTLLTGTIGKVYMIVFAACGVMFQILAGRMRAHRKNRSKVADQAYDDYLRSNPDLEHAGQAADPAAKPGKRSRGAKIRTVFMIILGAIFLIAAGCVVAIMLQYNHSKSLYKEVAAQFTSTGKQTSSNQPQSGVEDEAAPTANTTDHTAPSEAVPSQADPSASGQGLPRGTTTGSMESVRFCMDEVPDPYAEYIIRPQGTRAMLIPYVKPQVIAPIEVDFEGLREVNEEVTGWIYCEDTVINYPVMQADNNDKYLRHTYDGAYNIAGSIFVEGNNRRDFQDANTIIYGHHMQDGSMFATLDKWADQEYFEKHPEMWLLTPERDYRIVLLAGYHTSAYSDTYNIYQEFDDDFAAYLREALDRSDFSADLSQVFYVEDTPQGPQVTLDASGHYVVLSTCAYIFNNARYVIHGILVPADSAGGKPLGPQPAPAES